MFVLGPLGAIVGGLALGGISAGISGIANAKKQREAKAEAQKANQEILARNQSAVADAQRQSAALRAQLDADLASANKARQAALAKMTPEGSTNLFGLGTIATSPLGDTSEATVGRSKLLGN